MLITDKFFVSPEQKPIFENQDLMYNQWLVLKRKLFYLTLNFKLACENPINSKLWDYLKQSATFRSFDKANRKVTAKRNFSKFWYDGHLGSDFCIGSQLGSHKLSHACKQSDAT